MEGWQVKEAFCPGVRELPRLASHLTALQLAQKPSQVYHLSHTSPSSPPAVPLATSDHLGESHGLSTGVTAVSLHSVLFKVWKCSWQLLVIHRLRFGAVCLRRSWGKKMAFRHCAEDSRENPGCGLAVLQKYFFFFFFSGGLAWAIDFKGVWFFSVPFEMFPFREECL